MSLSFITSLAKDHDCVYAFGKGGLRLASMAASVAAAAAVCAARARGRRRRDRESRPEPEIELALLDYCLKMCA